MKNLYNYLVEHQRVFVVVKPGSLDLCQIVIERFKENNWVVDKTITKQLLLSEAKNMYKVHKNKDFYKSLCEYMSSGPCRAFIFMKPGHTSQKSFDEVAKIKDEIRKEYGESDMRNVLHSSDSQEAMNNEACIFFNIY